MAGKNTIIYSFTAQKLNEIISMKDASQQKAVLANLRRGIGKAPGDIPQLWGVLLENIPSTIMSRGGKANSAEWSIYTALTLFAMHQQGHEITTNAMHMKNISLGKAAALLVTSAEDEKRILRRFNATATAQDREELAHHLKGMVHLLSDSGVPLDYAKLAADLYNYQHLEAQPEVRLRWGQDFYGNRKEETSNE